MILLTNLSNEQNEELRALFDRIAAYPASVIDKTMTDGIPEIKDVADVVWGCDMRKSDPERGLFPEMLSVMDVHPHDVIYIDDEISDIMAASTSLIVSLIYQNPAQLEDELTQLGFEFYA